MLKALRGLWNGPDLPRGTNGRCRPVDARDGGTGALRGTQEEAQREAPVRAGSLVVDHEGRVANTSGQRMDARAFYAMTEHERLTWYHSQQRVMVIAPQHSTRLEWYGP